MGNTDHLNFAGFVTDFCELPELRERILHVLSALPGEVQIDFFQDPRFTISLDNFKRGKGSTVFMAIPGSPAQTSRSVVLKPLLATCSAEFANYVIAHEFAHAFLRNGAWDEITDVECAADALAASWGFDRPAITPWNQP